MGLTVTREPAQQKLRTSLTRISSTTANDHASHAISTIIGQFPPVLDSDFSEFTIDVSCTLQ